MCYKPSELYSSASLSQLCLKQAKSLGTADHTCLQTRSQLGWIYPEKMNHAIRRPLALYISRLLLMKSKLLSHGDARKKIGRQGFAQSII